MLEDILERELSDIDLEVDTISKLDNVDDSFDRIIDEPETRENRKMKDIQNFFEIANENVKSATEIFNKSVAMKNKLLEEANNLKRQRENHEKMTKLEIEKITQYRDELKEKFNAKKAELDREKETVEEIKASIERSQKSFEEYKIRELDKIKQQQKQQEEYISKREQQLREEKELLEREKETLENSRIKYEEDAKELENNLRKFNDLVSNFTDGMEKFTNE